MIFLLIGVIGYSQKYKITYTVSAQAEPCSPDPIRNSLNRFLIENTDNNRRFTLAQATCSKLIDNKTNAVAIINFLPNSISEKVYAETTTGSIVLDEFQRIPVNFNHCDDRTVTFSTFGNSVKVTIEPYTEINAQPVDNSLCNITLQVDEDGFAPEVYVWQYYDVLSTKTDKWTDFPTSFQGKYKINFGIEELFGNKANDYYYKAIDFRMKRYCNGKTTKAIGYVLIGCSPEIEGKPKSKNVSCNYKTDGGFTVNLKRDLYDGETIVITLYDITDAANVIVFDQEYTDTLVSNGDGTYSYKWRSNLDAGKYEIKYQTHDKPNGINTRDNSWRSVVPSDPFYVVKPKAVTYSLTSAVDKTCFTRDDGYIDIEADGENGRTFFYQYLKNGIIQKVGGQEWIPFTNAKTTRITRLGEANYRIKVQDSEKCFYRK